MSMVLLILIIVCVSATLQNQIHSADFGENPMRSFFKSIDTRSLERYLIENALRRNYLQSAYNLINRPRRAEQSEGCANCLFVVDGLQIIFRELDAKYTDLFNESVEICTGIVEPWGWRGDILCPGLIHNYGPNVEYIFKAKAFTGERVCVMNANECRPDEIDQDSETYREFLRLTSAPPPSKPTSTKPVKSEITTDGKSLKILHIADMHIDLRYEPGTVSNCRLPSCCRKGLEGTGRAGYWGAPGCSIGPNAMNVILRQYRERYDPDIVLYAGDNSVAANWEESQSFMLNNSAWIGQALARHFPRAKVYGAMGNHEHFPTNLYHSKKDTSIELQDVYATVWGPAAGFGEEQYKTFRTGGYYSILIQKGLRIIGLNTNFCSPENWYSILTDDQYRVMMNYVRETLKNATDAGEKVIILGHHPSRDQALFQGNEMLDLFVEYADTIVLASYGHFHANDFYMALDRATGKAASLIQVAHAVGSGTNTMSRIYEMDSKTFEVLDFTGYRVDTNNVAKDKEPQIQFHYNAKQAFELEDLSVQSWYNLTERFLTDAKMFSVYQSYSQGRARPGPITCRGECLKSMVCKIRAFTETERRKC